MIVGKEFKSMFQFLSKVYDILNKGGDNTILYVNDECELMYQAFCVSGKIRITKDNETMLQDELEKRMFYELSRLPRDRFKLKPVSRQDETDDMKEALEKLKSRFASPSTFVCELAAIEHHLMSRVTRLCERYISDSYLGAIKKFGACEVSTAGSYITLAKNEFFKDEMLNAEEYMCLYCETYKSVDETVQGKLRFEEEQKYGGNE